MNIMQNVHGILDYINTATAGKGLALNENNVASLAIDDDIICMFCALEEEEMLVVSLYLGRVDQSNPSLLHEMLCGNFMGAYTSGGTLSIDPEEGLVTLYRSFSLPIDEPAWIEEPLSGLIGAARYWRDKISTAQIPHGNSAATSSTEHLIRV